mgnify:CR=1 FL=1
MTKLLLLHPDDNVLVCAADIARGEELFMGDEILVARESVAMGHKVARRAMPRGTKVLRYGAPIGSLTEDVEAGAWVHGHNLASDYIATHDRTAGEAA